MITREQIVTLLRTHTASVMSMDAASVPSGSSLAELGANSIDRMEIVTMTMEALRVTFPLVELRHADSIQALADLLVRKVASR